MLFTSSKYELSRGGATYIFKGRGEWGWCYLHLQSTSWLRVVLFTSSNYDFSRGGTIHIFKVQVEWGWCYLHLQSTSWVSVELFKSPKKELSEGGAWILVNKLRKLFSCGNTTSKQRANDFRRTIRKNGRNLMLRGCARGRKAKDVFYGCKVIRKLVRCSEPLR